MEVALEPGRAEVLQVGHLRGVVPESMRDSLRRGYSLWYAHTACHIMSRGHVPAPEPDNTHRWYLVMATERIPRMCRGERPWTGLRRWRSACSPEGQLWRCCGRSVPGGSSPGKAHLRPERARPRAGRRDEWITIHHVVCPARYDSPRAISDRPRMWSKRAGGGVHWWLARPRDRCCDVEDRNRFHCGQVQGRLP